MELLAGDLIAFISIAVLFFVPGCYLVNLNADQWGEKEGKPWE